MAPEAAKLRECPEQLAAGPVRCSSSSACETRRVFRKVLHVDSSHLPSPTISSLGLLHCTFLVSHLPQLLLTPAVPVGLWLMPRAGI